MHDKPGAAPDRKTRAAPAPAAARAPALGAGSVQDFLSPQSMLTPGLAGALVATIGSTVGSALHFNVIYCIIGLSFVVGLVVFVAANTLLVKGVFYILNSLIICSVGLGTLSTTGATFGSAPAVKAPAPTPGVTVQTVDLPVAPPAVTPTQ